MVGVEARGARLTSLTGMSDTERRGALAVLPQLVCRAGQPPRVRVETWDGVPVARSEVAADLAGLGFVRDDEAMVLYREYGGAG